jgi:hypothetical protein
MFRHCRCTFTFFVVLSLFMLVLVPMGSGVTASNGSHVTALPTVATGPTLPPYPWEGFTGPTLPPYPWEGFTGPTLPPYPWEGVV